MKRLTRQGGLALLLIMGITGLIWAAPFGNGGPHRSDILPFADGKFFFVTLQGEDLDVQTLTTAGVSCTYTSIAGNSVAWDNPKLFVHQFKKRNRITIRFKAHQVDANDGSGTISITLTPTNGSPVIVPPISVEQETTFDPCS